MDLPTYTNIWRIEKRLYKLYDLRLPMPLPIVWIGVFVGVFVPWSLLLVLVGVPVEMPWHVLFLVPPGIVTWLSTRPVIEGKRLTELLESHLRYLGQPKAWYRMAPTSEPEAVTFSGRVWRTMPARARTKGPRKVRHPQRRREGVTGPRQVRPAVAAAAAAASTAPVAEPPRTGWGSRRGTAPALKGRVRAAEGGSGGPGPRRERALVEEALGTGSAPAAAATPVEHVADSGTAVREVVSDEGRSGTRRPVRRVRAGTHGQEGAAPQVFFGGTANEEDTGREAAAVPGRDVAAEGRRAAEVVHAEMSAEALAAREAGVPIKTAESLKPAAGKPIDTEALRRLRRLAATADVPADVAGRVEGGAREGERPEDERARDQHRKGQPPRLGPGLVLSGTQRVWPPLNPDAKPIPRPSTRRAEGRVDTPRDAVQPVPLQQDAVERVSAPQGTAPQGTGPEGTGPQEAGQREAAPHASAVQEAVSQEGAPQEAAPQPVVEAQVADRVVGAVGGAPEGDGSRRTGEATEAPDVVSAVQKPGETGDHIGPGTADGSDAPKSDRGDRATAGGGALKGDRGGAAKTDGRDMQKGDRGGAATAGGGAKKGERGDRATADGNSAVGSESAAPTGDREAAADSLATSSEDRPAPAAGDAVKTEVGHETPADERTAPVADAREVVSGRGTTDEGAREAASERTAETTGRREAARKSVAPAVSADEPVSGREVPSKGVVPADESVGGRGAGRKGVVPAVSAHESVGGREVGRTGMASAASADESVGDGSVVDAREPVVGRDGAGRQGEPVGEIGVPVPRAGDGRVRRVESVVGRDSGGWRRIAQVVVGGGGVRTDGSEIDEARARGVFGGSRRIVVLGCTGGAGQSTTALMLGHAFAHYRDDRVVAVDASTGGGTLTSKIQPETPETLTSLLSGLDRVSGYLTMRGYTTRTASGLEVISADTDAGAEQRLADRSFFSDHRLGESMRLLDRHYKLAVIDPAAALAARLLPYADQLVLVVPASEEASEAVAMTYEWLDGHGCAELRRRAVMVVNGVSRRSMTDVEQAESVARGRCRAIVRVPWEDDLAPGGAEVVDPGQLRAAGRRAYLALAGVVVAGFAAQTVRPSEEELASDPPGTRIGER
ncbi:TcpE family conjugal transfer membrane protein [Nonomuraea insulae]|uniref:TcpE family conjugal transfer membrane protein n=1 Tax=Nonomuraea insulae TaxID=1616787 RepID=A0ABW1CXH2_9ACTN